MSITNVQSNSETDTRLGMLNTLLTTPHRDLAKVYPIHKDMIEQDPIFYRQLAAWYNMTGEIRDHKEMFVVNLCLSNFEGHRDIGLAMLRELPPYQLVRVVDFIHGRRKNKTIRTSSGRGKNKKIDVRREVENFGLNRNVPRSVKTEVIRYVREREAEPAWFDSTALIARKYLKRLYSLLHIEPSDRAQKILFDEEPPQDSSIAAVKQLRKAGTPAEQAKVIIDNKVPYRVASTVVSAMTPTVLFALITVMSDQELLNNLGSLKKRGAFKNTDLKEAIQERLEKAKKGKNVAAMKIGASKNASVLDKDIQKQVNEVADTQIKSKGRINCPTALIVDKSGSMNTAIEIGKNLCSMISAISNSDFYVYACDTLAYPIDADGDDLASWEKAFQGIRATGGTSCGIGIEMLRRNKQSVEQIIMITDEGENTSPPFLTTLKNYMEDMNISPRIIFVKCGRSVDGLEKKCLNNGIDYDAYIFDGDYYSLPNLIPFLTKPSKLDLLLEIMQFTLPQRRAS
jgi:hypothetical protein